MATSPPIPDHLRRRIELTTSCRDADELPRVVGAGEFSTHLGHEIQLMHNGVRVVRGGYYGEWMAEIIQRLKGVHEPQEEKAVAAVFSRLAADTRPEAPLVCVELGSFWAYYSLWFLDVFNDGRVVCLEPDPNFMSVGVANFALNNRTATFLSGAIGSPAGGTLDFVAESDGATRPTRLYTLDSLMGEAKLAHIDVLFVDIQGAEIALLESSQDLLRSGAVRFVVVSTHDMDATGSPMTHRHAEALLRSAGAHIVCEHSVSESVSADGLIVASFDPVDIDMAVEISRARAIDSCYGEWEPRLQQILEKLEQVEAQREHARHRAAEATREIDEVREKLAEPQHHVRALRESTSWRLTAPLRWVRARWRRSGDTR